MGSGERRVESDEKRLVGGVWGVVSGESSIEWRVKSVWRWECGDCVERGKGFWEKCVECVVKYPSSLLPSPIHTARG